MNKDKTKKRVLSGIRATGRLHLGNYLGAIKGMLELQNDPTYETFYMVADAHSITTPYDVEELKLAKREVIIDYLAAGLDPEKSTLFIQSDISAHYELAYLFSSVVTVARMQHLPTFKDKVKQHPQNVTMALLNYPVLMASDILIYKSDEVPVGVDQEPHLEVAREVARKMNSNYKTNFPEPVVFSTKGKYVPSLLGGGKMSKSVAGSYIALTDTLQTINAKLAKVPTDSGKGDQIPEKGPIANLFTFVDLYLSEEQSKTYKSAYLNEGVRYSELKAELANAIFNELKPFQMRRNEISKNTAYVDSVIVDGAKKASAVANDTLREVKNLMGV